MRTIKFRVWNIKKQIMDLVDELTFIENDGITYITTIKTEVCLRRDEAKIMQYIGINDCNGREIYEGDIVELDKKFAEAQGYSSTISEVVWDEDGALFDTPKIQYALSQHNSKYFTVIGNIFQTPQLLI